MSISIDWLTSIISIPQAYLTLEGGIIYLLDDNQLRLDLKDLEDDLEGIPYLKTHIHSTEVTISGVTYARFFEIIAPYTVTFEDGQYRVKFNGGTNNNILDVANVNQVSLVPQNSAGLQIVSVGSGVTEQDKLDIADRVWDESLSGHLTAGTFGLAISKMLGLLHENVKIDLTTQDVDDNMTIARVRVFPDKTTHDAATTDIADPPNEGETVIYDFTASFETGTNKLIAMDMVERP